jgi:hypothetical protein
MKPQTTEKDILGCVTTFAGMIIAAVLVATCNSCAAPSKLYTNETKEYLTVPNPNDKMVVFSDYKYLYCINKPQNDSIISFKKKDIMKVRNVDHLALPFGTHLICLDEFRNF